jgi:ATP-dependent Clp protease ATP-binding subunit ClpB
MVRIDMSEYMEPHSVARLIGAPPGYVGHDEGGQLTEPVRRRPHSVVLFDEVEKAHAQVFNVLLQVLDDGRLTDSQGRTVDFSNTIIVMTSNLGSEHLLNCPSPPGGFDAVKQRVMGVVRKFFRPEFLNRLDDCIMFRSLGFGELTEIVEATIKELCLRLVERKINVTASDAAKEYILEQGYDAEYGARPLKRWVERNIVTELSRMIIGDMLPDESDVLIGVNPSKTKLTFSVKRRNPSS